MKFETGKTLKQYFQLKRLETANRTLMKSDTAPTAATQLGYPNVQFFSLVFKKLIGVAPSDYWYSQT